MLPDGRHLGAHLPLASGAVRAVERAHAIGATALQVFSDNPSAWRRRTEAPPELLAFRRRLTEVALGPVAIHAAYLINLAGPDPERFERSVALLTHELRQALDFGASLVNVHTGSHRDTSPAEGIARLTEGVHRVLAEVEGGPDAARLVLENSAGGGWAVGATVEDLAALADAMAARGIPAGRVGFCLDTAHLWGAGEAIGDPAGVDDLVERFDRLIGLERLHLIHLNDSRVEPGSRSDRHEHLGAGRIGVAGLRRILTHARLGHATYILETPGMDVGYDAVNLARARAIAAGEPLEPLPPEAFEVRSGRARPGSDRAAG